VSIPTFSLCHATARVPLGWLDAFRAWQSNCDNWQQVEYILCVDKVDRDKWPVIFNRLDPDIRFVLNQGRSCVSAWNTAAAASTGRFLINIADDLYPCPHWDTELLKVIPDLDGEYVVEVKSGTSPADDEWFRLMLQSFVTRPYYERKGYLFHPDYDGWYSDVEFTEVARRDGVVVDARHLTFQHKHWIGTSVPQDAIYSKQLDGQEEGLAVLGARRALGFPSMGKDPNR